MPRFAYKAVSMTGENIAGEFFATDREGVVAMLRSGGLFPLDIAQQSEKVKAQSKVKLKFLATFCSQLAAMLKAGVPIAKTLEILKDQTENKRLAEILNDVFAQVQKGVNLTDSFTPHAGAFPGIFMNMLEAGEASGTLDTCMERAGLTFLRQAKTNRKLQSAMIYPCFLLGVVVIVLIGMFVFVIPQFVGLYADNNAELPGFTKFLIAVSDLFVQRWYVPLIVVAAVVTGFRLGLRSDAGRTGFDRWKTKMPVLAKFIAKIYAARYARTLSSLNAAGVPLAQALTVTSRSVGNRHIEKALLRVVDSIHNGEDLSGPLERENVLPPMIHYMTRLGEESGTLDTLLDNAADYFDEESDAAIANMTAMMEPALIILMAIIIVPVIFGIVMPVFGMANTMLG